MNSIKSMKRKRIAPWLLLAAVFVFVVFVCIGYAKVNAEFQKQPEINIPMGEVYETEQFSLVVLDAYFVPDEEAKVLQGDWYDSDDEVKTMGVTLIISNCSDIGILQECLQMTMVKSDGFCNGMCRSDDLDNLTEISPKDKVSVTLYYDIPSNHFTDKQWEKIEDRSFMVMVTSSAYPQEVNMLLS